MQIQENKEHYPESMKQIIQESREYKQAQAQDEMHVMHQYEWRQQNWAYKSILQQAADTKLKKSIQHDKFAYKDKRQKIINKAPTYKKEDLLYTSFEKLIIAERKKE